MKHLIFRCMLTVLVLSGVSCNKFVDVAPPVTSLTSSNVFADAASVNAAMAGLYTYTFRTTAIFTLGDWYCGMLADEINYVSFTTIYDGLRYNTITSVDGTISNFWVGPYAIIYQSNALIENLSSTTVISTQQRDRYIAEAKFFRAYAHLLVSNFYGDVPLLLTTDVVKNSLAPRTPRADVYKAIVADLLDAEAVLTTGTTNNRVNKGVAQALLARAYLYQKDWANAEAKATAVINSGNYSLLTNLNQIFLRGSREAIFQYSSVNAGGTYDGYTNLGSVILPASTAVAPATLINTSMLQAFEAGDGRKTSWTNSSTVTGTTYYYPYKYKLKSAPASAALAEEYVLLRLGEQYLIRAEARARQNHLPEALSDLNTIRTRAGLSALPAMDQAATLLAVEKERRTELCFEGARWPDLARTSRANDVLRAEKPTTWIARDTLLPVPALDILNNPNLKQTPGY